jgi:DnaK suppressor protein
MGYKQIKTDYPNRTDLKRFKAILLAKQKEILGNVISMENEALRRSNTDLSSFPYHMADLATDNYELENTLELVGSERNTLWEILEALARIQNGTYGVCEGNGELIPRARLRAIPWTRYCVHCASLNERGLLYRESDFDDPSHKEGDAPS